MPARRKTAKRRVTRRRRIYGAGFWGDLWSGIKNVAKKVGNAFNDSLKTNKTISKAAATLAPDIPFGLGDTLTGTVQNLGYGRRRKRVVRRRVVRRVGGAMVRMVKVPGGRKRRVGRPRKRGGAGSTMRLAVVPYGSGLML